MATTEKQPPKSGGRRLPPDHVPCLGFRYTKEQEARAARAIASANRFMENYGKGRKPCNIDRSHYITIFNRHAGTKTKA